MSLSNPKQENPVTKWIEYSGETGKFFFYDKEKAEKVNMPDKLSFIVLEEMNTITGFSKNYTSGIYSNEVLDVSKEKLHVKTFKGAFSAVGLYKDIKETVVSQGGHFTKSVYAVIIRADGTLTEIVNFKFKGAGLQGWFDKKVSVYKSAVNFSDTITGKTGNIVYKVPVFTAIPFTEIQYKEACMKEQELQKYLEQYKNKQIIEDTIPVNDNEFNQEATHQETFNQETKESIQKANQEIITEDLPF